MDSARDGVLPDLLPSLRWSTFLQSCRDTLLLLLYFWRCLRFSSSTRRWSSSWIRWLVVQTVPKTVWKFLVVQKTMEISQLQFIDKVLPYDVAQRQIPKVLRGSSWTRLSSCPLRADSAGFDVQKTVVSRSCNSMWSAAVLGQGCLHARCVQTVLGSRRAENWRVPQLQFSTKWTCPLLRRQVHLVPQSRKLWRERNCRACRCLLCSSSTVVDIPVIKQRQSWDFATFFKNGR